MALDPSIILQGGQINDPNALVALKLNMQKLQANDQAMQGQNMLRAVLSSPQSYTNGQLTPQARQAVTAADPQLGMEFQKQDYGQQVMAAQARASQTEAGKTKFDFISSLAGIGSDAYDTAKKDGKSEQEARAIAASARNEAAEAAYKTGSGVLSEDEFKSVTGAQFDPGKATALASVNKDWATRRERMTKDATDATSATRKEDETERHNQETEKAAMVRDNALVTAANKKPEGGWQQETVKVKRPDGSTEEIQAFVNPGERKFTDAAGNPIDPSSVVGAVKTGTASKSGGAEFTPKMGEMMAALAEKGVALPSGFRSKEQQAALYSGILERNPGKTPDEIADMIKKGEIEFGAQKKETSTAAGIAGKVQVFANELDENIPLVRKAAAAVPRKEWTDLNSLIQTKDSHISNPELKTLKGYITSTLNAYDALAARGGTDKDKRTENRKTLLAADGPEAFEAQLKVFENEARVAKKAAFEATKSPELPGDGQTKKIEPPKTAGDIQAVSSKEAYDALPEGAHYSKPGDAPGSYRTKK